MDYDDKALNRALSFACRHPYKFNFHNVFILKLLVFNMANTISKKEGHYEFGR